MHYGALIVALLLVAVFSIWAFCDFQATCKAAARDERLDNIRRNPNSYLFGETEFDEQVLVLKHLPQDSAVLELGGRTGTVSKAISLILADKTKHVVVEPSTNASMIQNLEESGKECGFKVFNGALGKGDVQFDGYFSVGSPLFNQKDSSNVVNTKTLEDIEGEYNIKFTAIIADCEGCLVQVLEDFPQLLNQIEHLNVEYDMSHETCAKLVSKLENAGFKSVERGGGIGGHPELGTRGGTGFEVWKK